MTEERDPSDQTTETGHGGVDRVLASLQGLEERPVDEHVGMFERAHEDLRRALTDAGDHD
jgi:hypothetical protein